MINGIFYRKNRFQNDGFTRELFLRSKRRDFYQIGRLKSVLNSNIIVILVAYETGISENNELIANLNTELIFDFFKP